MLDKDRHYDIEKYYGEILSSTKDLKTNACCSNDSLSPQAREVLKGLHPEITERFYGCGSPIPPLLKGLNVLDLGCGTGRDSYIISKLAGEGGRVFGIDMTEGQISIAKKHISYQTNIFGYSSPNIEFHRGYIEDLSEVNIQDNSIDLVVSNCVINLSPNKEKVFSEILRVLKPGGELYFSDIFADRRIPENIVSDPVLRGECLSGALYIQDFRRLMTDVGFNDYRVVSGNTVSISNAEIENKIGMISFSSLTMRAFKLDLEDRCEDYGQIAYYLGTIHGMPHSFVLDDHHELYTLRPFAVCGNTAAMLSETRYAKHFKITGNKDIHFGLFDCNTDLVSGSQIARSNTSCC